MTVLSSGLENRYRFHEGMYVRLGRQATQPRMREGGRSQIEAFGIANVNVNLC